MRSASLCIVAALAVALGVKPHTEAQEAKGLTVHEWGVINVYNDVELANADMRAEWAGLPKFVYGQVDGRPQPESMAPVFAPVIYFHAPQPLSLSVLVNFPKGKPAVWWPANNSTVNRRQFQPPPLTSLTWNVQLKSPNANNAKHADLPKGHWMEALRDVKADDVLVHAGSGQQLERFIYYDGLMPAPGGLDVRVAGDQVSLKSRAKHPLLDVTVVDLRNVRKIRTAAITRLDPEAEVKEAKFVERAQSKWPFDGIEELVGQLKAAGLNEDEAKALTQVWRKSFFETEGVTVFYRLPQEIYDQVLPLTVTPRPEKTVRTLLLHHPHCEPDLRERVLGFAKDLGSDKFQERIEAQRRLTALGRAAFVHLMRARNEAKDPEVQARLSKVLEEFESEKGFSK